MGDGERDLALFHRLALVDAARERAAERDRRSPGDEQERAVLAHRRGALGGDLEGDGQLADKVVGLFEIVVPKCDLGHTRVREQSAGQWNSALRRSGGELRSAAPGSMPRHRAAHAYEYGIAEGSSRAAA